MTSKSFFVQRCFCIFFCHSNNIRNFYFAVCLFCCNSGIKSFEDTGSFADCKDNNEQNNDHDNNHKNLHKLTHTWIYIFAAFFLAGLFPVIYIIVIIIVSVTFAAIAFVVIIIIVVFIIIIIAIAFVVIVIVIVILVVIIIIITTTDIVQFFIRDDHGIGIAKRRDHYEISIRIYQ